MNTELGFKGEFSCFGKISASWKRENGRIIYTLGYPESAEKHIVLCGNDADEIVVNKTQ